MELSTLNILEINAFYAFLIKTYLSLYLSASFCFTKGEYKMFNIKNLKIKENYISFSEYQLAVLDMQLFNGNKNKKIQSVLRYVMQYSKNNKLVYSIHRLYKMYTSKNKRMSQRYFYNLISELKDLNLLEEKEK